MAEDLFKNQSSEIPDDMWKAPAPMQRQIDAAVLWAELTGKGNDAEDEESDKKASKPFLQQDRPKKVKEIYRALKRDHPTMSPEKKARIAARQGKPGKQKQGPPYKGPIKEAASLLEIGALGHKYPEVAGALVGAPIGAAERLYSSSRPSGQSLTRAEISARKALAGAIEKEKLLKSKSSVKSRIQAQQKLQRAQEEAGRPGLSAVRGAGKGAGQGALAGLMYRLGTRGSR